MSNKANDRKNGVPDAEKMDKVREILFGHELREIETKLGNTETDLHQQIEEIARAANKRLDELAAKQDLQNKNLLKELTSLDSNHLGLNNKSTTDHSKLVARVEKNRQDARQELRELRAHVNEQCKQLNAALKSQAKQLGTHFDEELESLRDSAVDRSALAAMFEEFAATLIGDEE